VKCVTGVGSEREEGISGVGVGEVGCTLGEGRERGGEAGV